MSGAPIKEAALATLRDITLTNGQIPLLGSAGFSGADARTYAGHPRPALHGARLRGTRIAPRIKTGSLSFFRDGFATVADAAGADVDVVANRKRSAGGDHEL